MLVGLREIGCITYTQGALEIFSSREVTEVKYISERNLFVALFSLSPSATNSAEVRAPFSFNANAPLQAISSAAFNGCWDAFAKEHSHIKLMWKLEV